MNTLLCSRNESVLRRWHEALKDNYKTYEATTPDHIYKLLAKITIDLVFLHRPMMNDSQLKELLGSAREKKIFILADRPSNQEGIAILRLGCIGYSNTYISGPRLNLAAQTVLSGLVWTGTSLMQHLLDGASHGNPVEARNGEENQNFLEKLSRREHQVASLVVEGLQNREIAERLDITERTVKAHLSSIYNKTETSGRIGLIKKFSRK